MECLIKDEATKTCGEVEIQLHALFTSPIQGMDVCVCVYSVFVLFCVWVAALRRADHSSKESYHLCKHNYETEEEARAQQRAIEQLMNE
jgi:hypothetical protein